MKTSDRGGLSAVQSTLRATGARVTPARVRVLQLLQGAPGPLGHGEIEAALRDGDLPGIDRVTLYRVLDWLCEAGLAHRAADARGVLRFSAAAPNVAHAGHMHFRCTHCGGVFCLKSPPPPPPALPRGFRLDGMVLDLHGECSRCVRTGS